MKKESKQWIGDWEQFDKISEKWDKMLIQLGTYGMAKLVIKTPSWRAYDQKWPFDNMATWESNLDIEDFRERAQQASVEDEVADRIMTQELIKNLTPKQKRYLRHLETVRIVLRLKKVKVTTLITQSGGRSTR